MEYKESFNIAVWVWAVVVVLLIKEVFTYLKGKSSERWPRHKATVVDVRVDVVKRGNRSSSQYEGQYSMPFVKYEYSCKGNTFKSKKMALNHDWSTDYGDSSEAVVGINPDSDIVIYVNPKKPKQSVLSRGYQGNNLKTLFFVFLFALACELTS